MTALLLLEKLTLDLLFSVLIFIFVHLLLFSLYPYSLFISLFSTQKYSECDVEVLLVRLDTIYGELNSILEKNKGFLISISVVSPTMVTASSNIILGGKISITKSRGAAEAYLFGHLTEALSHPMTSVLLLKHLALLAFVRNILEEYFLTPLRSPKNTLRTSLWEVNYLYFCIYLC